MSCHFVFVHDKYIIVEPVRAPSPIEVSERIVTEEMQEAEDISFNEKLERVSEEGFRDIAIIARSLLHIIRLLSLIMKKIIEIGC